MTIKLATTEQELLQIIDLQTINHFSNIDEATAQSQGFVTVRHTLDLLQDMNDAMPQVIAKDGEQVVGYALVMPPSFGDKIPVLVPMFEMFEKINYRDKKITEHHYYVMGQICIAADYRGLQVFDKLYAMHKTAYSSMFEICVTEVSVHNTRSMRAHERIGFKVAHTYTDESSTWNVLVWDWR